MWPALIFAANRNDRVIGRTAILTVSIKIRNGFSQAGAPAGRRDANVVKGLNEKLEKIKANQRGRPNLKVNKRWDVALKTKGIIPKKLMEVIKTYKETTKVVKPLRLVVEVRVDWSVIMPRGIDNSHCP